MADLNITASGVIAANANTVKANGIAAGTISAGQAVWLDSSVTPNLIRPAQGTALVQAQNIVGVALDNTVGSAQPISYATGGDIILPTTGAGSVLAQGQVYALSAASAGGIAPITDPGSANFISIMGLATNPNTLRLGIIALGAKR